MEISIILDYEVVYSKEFKNYAKELKNKIPNHDKMIEMESRFMTFLETDNHAKYLYSIATGVTIAACNTSMVYAKDLSGISDKIRQSTNPIIELLAGLGYPVTYAMLIVGAIMIITGKKSKGLEVIKWACIGYIGLQFVPFLLSMLEEIGRELRNS
ncbi:hypothetical protein [Clostridium sp.]|uniref:hypothetical protein n=1 Tax=Clostridium sp. TaxID=1506 RepID=UPI00284D401A|nr:hypothetical protein [Clostridium sp.]MDR3593575.1 hypothetical protein [Clostridium sp.]